MTITRYTLATRHIYTYVNDFSFPRRDLLAEKNFETPDAVYYLAARKVEPNNPRSRT